MVSVALSAALVQAFGDCKTWGSLSAAAGASKSAWKLHHNVWVIVRDVSEYASAFFFRVQLPKETQFLFLSSRPSEQSAVVTTTVRREFQQNLTF